jgi:hypothetical protein
MATTRAWISASVRLLIATGALAGSLLAGSLLAGSLLAGSLLAGCGSATHIDMYYGTDAGADFAQPEREAGLENPDAADAGVD